MHSKNEKWYFFLSTLYFFESDLQLLWGHLKLFQSIKKKAPLKGSLDII